MDAFNGVDAVEERASELKYRAEENTQNKA